MAGRRELGVGNATIRGDTSRPPWREWRTRKRVDRCVRFIEAYCPIPAGYGVGRLMKLHPFQRDALAELLEDGRKSAAWQVCRGNGKSSLIAALALWAVCDEPDSPVVPIIAGDMKQVERTLLRPIVGMIDRQPQFRERLHVYRAQGDKRIHSWWNGGDILPLPASVDSLQGLQPTVAIVDEGEVVPWDVYWVLRQGGGKRPGSTILMIGTPGPDLESALYRFRTLVTADPAIGHYVEMSAPADADVTDVAAWEAANPAIGAGFLDRDTVAVEARAAHLDEVVADEFRMRRLGQWPDGDGPLDPFSRSLRRCETDLVDPSGPPVFAADIGLEGAEAVIVVAAGGVLEVIDRRLGTAWLPDRLLELVDRHGGVVACDGYAPVGARLFDIELRLGVTKLNQVEMMRASARFAEDVEAGALLIRTGELSPSLRKAVRGAQRFGTGDSWRWARRRSTGDIAPLVAATVAWYVSVTAGVPAIN